MIHRAQRYNSSQPWDIEDLPSEFVELAPREMNEDRDYEMMDKGSGEFAEFVADFQTSFGLRPDGMLGPRTLHAIRKMYARDEFKHELEKRVLFVNNRSESVSFDVIHGVQFKSRPRSKKPNVVNRPTRADLHESVTNDPDIFEDDDTTERILRRNGHGVHIMIGPDGTVVQHGDLALDMLAHVGRYNRPSIGIEVVGPYYKAHPPYWRTVIDAPWAHKGRYALPPMAQMEATWLVVDAIWTLSRGDSAPLAVSKVMAGTYPCTKNSSTIRVRMDRLPKRMKSNRSGVYAHGHTGHADGFFPALYVCLRMVGRTQLDAYREAVTLATGAKRYVDVEP